MAEAVGSVAERTSTSRQRSQRCSELSKVLHSLVMKLTGPSLTTSRSESDGSSFRRADDDDEEEEAALERVPKASRKKDRRLEEEDDAPIQSGKQRISPPLFEHLLQFEPQSPLEPTDHHRVDLLEQAWLAFFFVFLADHNHKEAKAGDQLHHEEVGEREEVVEGGTGQLPLLRRQSCPGAYFSNPAEVMELSLSCCRRWATTLFVSAQT
ncbi:hypothetical protein TYRP_002759 [Tyrophagus putrescentiae]|nr:hypothetical protein TYRP_002759 [Tyrophagus putrescentiae]